jgi:hypothetical protein
MALRGLTIGELLLAQSVYGDKINLSGDIISSGKYVIGQKSDTAMTPRGVMYMGGTYLEDYSSGNATDIGLFIHELTHVYQYQQTNHWLGWSFSTKYEFANQILNDVPFSEWTIEQQAAYAEEMYYRSIGKSRYAKGITNEQLNAVEDGGLIEFNAPVHCFPANTAIQTSLTSTKPISEIRVGDVVMSFDPKADGGRGALVHKRVKRLFRNTTTEWIKLTWLENGEGKELVATPGHHMLDKTGAFMRLDLMVQNGKAEIVLASGEIVEANAERIAYSAETAHLFEQANTATNPAANGAVGLMN